MNKLSLLCDILHLHLKLPDERIRLLYLREQWGMEQQMLADLIGKSQAHVSMALKKAKTGVSTQNDEKALQVEWSVDEVKAIQFLPREILNDNEAAGFIIDILQVDVTHPFFTHNVFSETARAAGLASIGVRHRQLEKIFRKNQSTISMMVKRGLAATQYERSGRYDKTASYNIKPSDKVKKPIKDKFITTNHTNYHIW